jgi:hypothetical protein
VCHWVPSLFLHFPLSFLLFSPFLSADCRIIHIFVQRFYVRDIGHSESIIRALVRGLEGRKGHDFGAVFLVGSLLLCAASSLLYGF